MSICLQFNQRTSWCPWPSQAHIEVVCVCVSFNQSWLIVPCGRRKMENINRRAGHCITIMYVGPQVGPGLEKEPGLESTCNLLAQRWLCFHVICSFTTIPPPFSCVWIFTLSITSWSLISQNVPEPIQSVLLPGLTVFFSPLSFCFICVCVSGLTKILSSPLPHLLVHWF